MYYVKVYRSFDELNQAVTDYIFYYNNELIKAKLTGMSPVEYRLHTSQLAVRNLKSFLVSLFQLDSLNKDRTM